VFHNVLPSIETEEGSEEAVSCALRGFLTLRGHEKVGHAGVVEGWSVWRAGIAMDDG
jgi:hypothetical protein